MSFTTVSWIIAIIAIIIASPLILTILALDLYAIKQLFAFVWEKIAGVANKIYCKFN